jgi:hypothetical protein
VEIVTLRLFVVWHQQPNHFTDFLKFHYGRLTESSPAVLIFSHVDPSIIKSGVHKIINGLLHIFLINHFTANVEIQYGRQFSAILIHNET